MQRDSDRPAVSRADASEDAPDPLLAWRDPERPRRTAPALKKAVAYRREHVTVAEYPHSSRRNWPQIKALRHQIYRRGVDRALRPALGMTGPDIDDFAPDFPSPNKPRQFHLHGAVPLGTWVHDKLEKRLAFVGSNIADKLMFRRYGGRLLPFLESLVAGKSGHSVELALAFQRILDGVRQPKYRELGKRRRPLELHQREKWSCVLAELIREQPEWERQLRTWIVEVTKVVPPSDKPAWKRLRQLRRKPER